MVKAKSMPYTCNSHQKAARETFSNSSVVGPPLSLFALIPMIDQDQTERISLMKLIGILR